MAKQYEVMIYDDDGKGVTGAITESDIAEDSQSTYIGREWIDAEETAFIQKVLSSVAFRQELQQLWLHRGENEDEGWRVIGDYIGQKHTEIRHTKAWCHAYAQYTYGPVEIYGFGANVRRTKNPPSPRKDEPIWTVLDPEVGGVGIALDEVTFAEALEYVRNKAAKG